MQNPKNMHTSSKGQKYIRQYERFEPKPYDDGTGKMTIGYGHVIKNGENFNSISKPESIRLFEKDLNKVENVIKKLVTRNLTQKQFDALASFIYNVGESNFSNSTLLLYLNNDDFISENYPNMESAFKAFNKTYNPKTKKIETNYGLVNRRKDDWNIFEYGIYKIKR